MNYKFLSGNALKLIAAVSMLLDHIGLLFFPFNGIFRIFGRLALPIFAFMIAEGCAHTRSTLRYFLHVLILAVVCQTAYTVAMGSWYLCVPVSFALAIALVLALNMWKKAGKLWQKCLWGVVFFLAVAAVWLLNRIVTLDYGFWGCMMPVGASLLRRKKDQAAWYDRNVFHVLAMGIFMVPLALQLGTWQWWSFLALPLLSCYSGRRGKHKMKYFFYIFYPAHLLVVQGIAMLL